MEKAVFIKLAEFTSVKINIRFRFAEFSTKVKTRAQKEINEKQGQRMQSRNEQSDKEEINKNKRQEEVKNGRKKKRKKGREVKKDN